jgi:hypothetical protein
VDQEAAAKGGGKFKFWVVDAELGGDTKIGRKTTQTVKLSLKPSQDGKDLLVAGEGPPASR